MSFDNLPTELLPGIIWANTAAFLTVSRRFSAVVAANWEDLYQRRRRRIFDPHRPNYKFIYDVEHNRPGIRPPAAIIYEGCIMRHDGGIYTVLVGCRRSMKYEPKLGVVFARFRSGRMVVCTCSSMVPLGVSAFAGRQKEIAEWILSDRVFL